MRSSWSFVGLTPEARKAAEEAAEAAGMDLDTWLSQLIKYRSAIELRGDQSAVADGTVHDAASESSVEQQTPTEKSRAEKSSPINAGMEKPAPVSGAYVRPETQDRGDSGKDDTPGSAEAARETPASTAPRDEKPVGEMSRRERTARSLEARAAELRARGGSPRPKAVEPTFGNRSDESQAAVQTAVPHEPEEEPASNRPWEPVPPARENNDPARPGAKAATDRAGPSQTSPDDPMKRSSGRPAAPVVPLFAPPAGLDGDDAANAPRMIATDMLRPSLLGAINIVGKGEIDQAYDRWQRTGRLEPLVARPAPDAPGSLEIVAGIDRWHAARRGKAPEVPIIERVLNDEEAIREGLAARLKRGHLSALEEADIYLRLMTDAAQTTEQVARLAGKPPAHIATMVRILNLPKRVREMIERGDLTVLHARAMLDAADPEAVAEEIVERRLDIYQTEQLVRMAARDPSMLQGVSETPTPATVRTFDKTDARDGGSEAVGSNEASRSGGDSSTVTETPTDILERHLSHLLGLKVTISERGDDGVVSLHYSSRDQLGDLIARLNSSGES